MVSMYEQKATITPALKERRKPTVCHIDVIAVFFPSLCTAVVCLPIFGLAFAVFWSIIFDNEKSTSTSCHVPNFLPSVSAAIALTPQAYIWRVCISLHTVPRYLCTCAYWVWYSKQHYVNTTFLYSLRSFFKILSGLANVVELSALLGLTVVSSRENKPIHEACFVIFMIGSLTCMISSCILQSIIVHVTNDAKKSRNRKFLFTLIHILAFVISLYFYFRHNYYCEEGVYSMFALCEYIVILSNIGFHYTVSLDFSIHSLRVTEDQVVTDYDQTSIASKNKLN